MSLYFFSTFSYFENKTDAGYLSKYPSGPGKCKFTGSIPANGTAVFKITTPNLYQHLINFLYALKQNEFGFSDFFFLAQQNDTNTYTGRELIEWYQSLYFENGVIENDICKIQIKSNLTSTFSTTCYLKDTPLPQEALDTLVFFCNTSTYTALGNKRKSESVSVHFISDVISLLNVGMHGTVILGEHLEANEKKEMNSAFDAYRENEKKTGKQYMRISDRAVKPAMRALAEEFGFHSTDFNFETYIVGKDTQDGRDPRYWTFGNSGEYGYKRHSESLMVALLAKCEIPTEIPDPEDLSECSKGVIVPVEYALSEFSTTGHLKCAFPSHPRQLRLCVERLNLN
jgi:hypothetical protein